MNINALRLVSIGVITGFVIMCKDTCVFQFLNARTIILLFLAATHYRFSDVHIKNATTTMSILHITMKLVNTSSKTT